MVSDGLGFYVAPNLARLGLADLPVATNENRLRDGGRGLSFPYGHPACFVCGTCKRERVRAHQALGRVVVFIGDGSSDRYAAFHADLVFAKGDLAGFCAAAGWPFRPWADFAEVTAWLDRRHRRGRAAGERRGRARLAGRQPLHGGARGPALHLRPGGMGPRPDHAGQPPLGSLASPRRVRGLPRRPASGTI